MSSLSRNGGAYDGQAQQDSIHPREGAHHPRAISVRREGCVERASASAQKENDFIEQHGFEEYAKWHLGINDEEAEHTKGRYEFPYGNFKDVHRCGVLSAESRAGQYKHFDIETAAAHLHGMIDALAGDRSPTQARSAHRGGTARR
jgi:hypothetical protein